MSKKLENHDSFVLREKPKDCCQGVCAKERIKELEAKIQDMTRHMCGSCFDELRHRES